MEILTELELSLRCKQLKDSGLDVSKLCEIFGVKKSVIYNYLKVAEVDEPTRDCLQLGIISLNHAVELARLEDSKRLETLVSVVSHRWSVRQLKEWIQTGNGPSMWLSLEGWIPICPKHLEYAPVTKVNRELYETGPYKKHRSKPPIDRFSCDTCGKIMPYPGGKYVLCGYDKSHLPNGIKTLIAIANKLVEIEEKPRTQAIKDLEEMAQKCEEAAR